MERLLISVNEKMPWSTLNQLECLVLRITIWQVLSILVFHVDFAIHTMAIDNELEDEQKAARIQEVHQLCETFKKSEMNQKNIEIADHIPLSCEDQSIIDEIDSIEFFEKRNIVYKFWKSMFGHFMVGSVPDTHFAMLHRSHAGFASNSCSFHSNCCAFDSHRSRVYST